MSKSEVYSWRLTPELKMELEFAARAEKTTIAEVLERLTQDWLKRRKSPDDEAEQARLKAKVMKLAGSIALGEGPYTNKRIRESFTEKVKPRHGRTRAD